MKANPWLRALTLANLVFVILNLAGLAAFLYPFWAPAQTAATQSRAALLLFSGAAALALLALIAEPPVACAGCDVCEGTARAAARGAPEILAFARAHPRLFIPVRAAEALSGARSARVQREFLDQLPEYGALVGWERVDIEEAITELVAAGHLRIVRRGPWAGRLAPTSARTRSPRPSAPARRPPGGGPSRHGSTA